MQNTLLPPRVYWLGKLLDISVGIRTAILGHCTDNFRHITKGIKARTPESGCRPHYQFALHSRIVVHIADRPSRAQRHRKDQDQYDHSV